MRHELFENSEVNIWINYSNLIKRNDFKITDEGFNTVNMLSKLCFVKAYIQSKLS